METLTLPTEADEVVDLPDGRSLRLRCEQDDYSVLDDDWYGKIAPEKYRWGTREYRPEGFNGRARKIRTRSDTFWWQPPDDVTDDQLNNLLNTLVDILEYGYSVLTLELLAPERDIYGYRPVLAAASLGGMEPFPDDDHVRDVVADLACELGFDPNLTDNEGNTQ